MNAQQANDFMTRLGNPLYITRDPVSVAKGYVLTDADIKRLRGAIKELEAMRFEPQEQFDAAKKQAKASIEGRHTEGRKKGEPVWPPRTWPAKWEKWETETGTSLRRRLEAYTAKIAELEAVIETALKAREQKEIERLDGMVKAFPAKVKKVQDAAQVKPELVKAVLALAEALAEALDGKSLEAALLPALNVPAQVLDLKAEREYLINQGRDLNELPKIKVPEGLLKAVETILGHEPANFENRSAEWERYERAQINKRLDDMVLGK